MSPLKALNGRKIAIDASMSIYQFLIAVRQGGDANVHQQLTNEAGEVSEPRADIPKNKHTQGHTHRDTRTGTHAQGLATSGRKTRVTTVPNIPPLFKTSSLSLPLPPSLSP